MSIVAAGTLQTKRYFRGIGRAHIKDSHDGKDYNGVERMDGTIVSMGRYKASSSP